MDENKKFKRPRLSRLLLALTAVLITIGAIEFAVRLTSRRDDISTSENLVRPIFDGNPGGYRLRKTAWEASFTERGLEVPAGGPREGLRGEGVTPLKCAASDCNFIKLVPGIIELNDDGVQSVGKGENPYPHILIVGGSVAWGAGASDISNTYFSKLYGMLKNDFPDTRISVLAYYGSTSNTDLISFVRKGLDVKPDIVVFLNGLNDLTVRGKQRQTDVSDYILNMKVAAMIAKRNGIPVVVIRQPYPGGKKNRSDLETRIMELSDKNYESIVVPAYKHLGNSLEKMAERGEILYIDASDCFENELATTFNDQWHFSDPGQELLAERIYDGLNPILREIVKDQKGANH